MKKRSRVRKAMRREAFLVALLATAFATVAFPMFAAADSDGTTETTPPESTIPAIPAGGIIVGDEIVFDGGKVMLSLGAVGFDDCLVNYVCLWEHRDFGGRRLQFTDCCWWQSLWTYDFQNQASSSRNRKGVDGQIATSTGGNGSRLCLGAGGHFVYLGDVFNDNAESINAGTTC